MPESQAAITLPQAERVLFKMCKHYALKVPVAYAGDTARITFPMGQCRIDRREDTLHVHCDAASRAALEKVQYIMDEHLVLMSRDKGLVVNWHAAEPS